MRLPDHLVEEEAQALRAVAQVGGLAPHEQVQRDVTHPSAVCSRRVVLPCCVGDGLAGEEAVGGDDKELAPRDIIAQQLLVDMLDCLVPCQHCDC